MFQVTSKVFYLGRCDSHQMKFASVGPIMHQARTIFKLAALILGDLPENTFAWHACEN
jgi:hypothetical protein